MAWTAPRTWVAGETVTASIMNTHVRDNLKAIGDPWTSYTPTLTNITLNNGTLTAAWGQAGKFTFGRVKFVAGSSTSYSAGALTFTLPASYAGLDTSVDVLGYGQVNNNSAASRQVCTLVPTATSGAGVGMSYNGANVSNTTPFTWAATTSRFMFEFAYEAA